MGIHVEITEIDFEGDERHGLTATVTHGEGRWNVSILDAGVSTDEVRFTRLTHAYRRWIGQDR